LPFFFIEKKTRLGKVRFRRASGTFTKNTPEYEDCRAIAKKRKIPLLEVYRRLARG
jgi:uncharacterized protein (DUF111 family)